MPILVRALFNASTGNISCRYWYWTKIYQYWHGTLLELYPDLVFCFSIGWYFPGIFPTNTKGKLGRDVLVLYIWRKPLFSLKGRLLPPFWWTKPPFWGENKFPLNLQKGVPAKFHKMELLPNLTVQKIPNRISTGMQVPVTTNTSQTASKQMEYNREQLYYRYILVRR